MTLTDRAIRRADDWLEDIRRVRGTLSRAEALHLWTAAFWRAYDALKREDEQRPPVPAGWEHAR